MPAVRDYVPYSWIALVQVKREHYAAIAHYHSAVGMLFKSLEELSCHTKRMLQLMHTTPLNEIYSSSFTDEQRIQLGNGNELKIVKRIIKKGEIIYIFFIQKEKPILSLRYYFTKKHTVFLDFVEN